ncbi:MAG: hypothetical protein ACW986_11420 [Promethearchaeota archaeon]|jgi:hypothetical protein
MAAGKILAILGGLLTILGTYVFAIYGSTPIVGSGIGFILNIPELFADAGTIAPLLSTPVWLFYIYVIIFVVFLAAGILQIIGMKNRVISFIFSLFPLGVGLMFIFLVYTDFLGIKSAFFAFVFIGEHYANFFPILVPLGDLALGAYFLIAGGALGIVSVFAGRD